MLFFFNDDVQLHHKDELHAITEGLLPRIRDEKLGCESPTIVYGEEPDEALFTDEDENDIDPEYICGDCRTNILLESRPGQTPDFVMYCECRRYI